MQRPLDIGSSVCVCVVGGGGVCVCVFYHSKNSIFRVERKTHNTVSRNTLTVGKHTSGNPKVLKHQLPL